ncbi:hypothetical protein X979_5491 [Burkholderia pseudomallei MSHR7527]|nr:hypothetical protein X979_5491 [Burkholderia pseudomallei MSHR7527]
MWQCRVAIRDALPDPLRTARSFQQIGKPRVEFIRSSDSSRYGVPVSLHTVRQLRSIDNFLKGQSHLLRTAMATDECFFTGLHSDHESFHVRCSTIRQAALFRCVFWKPVDADSFLRKCGRRRDLVPEGRTCPDFFDVLESD